MSAETLSCGLLNLTFEGVLMNTSNEAKTTGYLMARIGEQENFEADQLSISAVPSIIAGGSRKDSGKGIYFEFRRSIKPGTYDVSMANGAWYNHRGGERSWLAESGTFTIKSIELDPEPKIDYTFDIVAVEPAGEKRRVKLVGSAELKGLWCDSKVDMC
jgi:hypothetical protein